jgi:hypothetical protein
VKRSEWLFSPERAVGAHASVNAAPAADRRFGMAKRIEQSRRHGHHDPRWLWPVLQVDRSPLPVDAPAAREQTRPTLTVVGGTDVPPKDLDPITARRF